MNNIAEFTFYILGYEADWSRTLLRKKIKDGEAEELFQSAIKFHSKWLTKDDIERETAKYNQYLKAYS